MLNEIMLSLLFTQERNIYKVINPAYYWRKYNKSYRINKYIIQVQLKEFNYSSAFKSKLTVCRKSNTYNENNQELEIVDVL